jgi:photosystem II stability/assembly factor-like uncharacterized protein
MPRKAPIFARRRRGRLRRVAGWLPVGLVIVLAASLAAVRALDEDAARSTDPGPVHVHALGLDPANLSLFIATHTGLFRLPPGQATAERVGDRHQDTMGFTIAGPDHFLGSGHPDLRDDLPPLLGLIESRDAGQTWKSISLLGEVDFHVLRVDGLHVVGYDATSGRILISTDGGRTWKDQRPPERLYDLVVHPNSTQTLIATGKNRLFTSRDGGMTWSLRERGSGLLAWPRRDRLYVLDPSGRVWMSQDGGTRWQARGPIGAMPAAFLAVDSHLLYAAAHDGSIKRSSDGGATWIARSAP